MVRSHLGDRRRIAYVTGTRADFGLMESTLRAIWKCPTLELSIFATGTHLSEAYGNTIQDIEAAGLPVLARIQIDAGEPGGARMARNIGLMTSSFAEEFARAQPDIVLLLGDRGEMLAAAIAALHLNIPIAHIHGGERSGTVDEPIRHAISKLSHFHFVATEESRARLVRMGEVPERVFVVGAPGLDGIADQANMDKKTLFRVRSLDEDRPLVLFLFHPVLQETDEARSSTATILDGLRETSVQVFALIPNSDAGGGAIKLELETRAARKELTLATHLHRSEFLSFLKVANALIGNSSSGIIEAATFGTPVLNIGSRQNLRERNANVIDVGTSAGAVASGLRAVLTAARGTGRNVYGDGNAGQRIVTLLATLPITSELMFKSNAY